MFFFFCDFIQVFVFTTNYHLKGLLIALLCMIDVTVTLLKSLCCVLLKEFLNSMSVAFLHFILDVDLKLFQRFIIMVMLFNPLYTGRLLHCNIMDEYICHFRGVGSILPV